MWANSYVVDVATAIVGYAADVSRVSEETLSHSAQLEILE